MRTKQAKKRQMMPDKQYDSASVTKFIHMVMLDGKKDLAQRLVYRSLEQAAERLGVEPVDVFEKALKNVQPSIEVRSRRVGGATYQVPTPVPTERKEMLAMRWIIQAARSKTGKNFTTLLASELVSAYNEEGEAIRTRDNVHKMAEANRAFAHFRW